jgi:ATP-dependent Clp protease protease subunit
LGDAAEIVINTPILAWVDEAFDFAYFRGVLAGYGDKPLTLWINSPGGDPFAAAEIYTALKEYKGETTVKIPAFAASAATVIALAAAKVYMSRPAVMVIHQAWRGAVGNGDQLREAASTVDEITAGMLAVYHDKTGIPLEELWAMVAGDYWMSAQKAVELGFADGILEEVLPGDAPAAQTPAFAFSRKASDEKIAAAIAGFEPPAADAEVKAARMVVAQMELDGLRLRV